MRVGKNKLIFKKIGIFIVISTLCLTGLTALPASTIEPRITLTSETDIDNIKIIFNDPKTIACGSSSWWDSDWQYRKEITIDSTMTVADFSNFPVLISFSSDSDLASDAQSDGDDIVFTDESGIKLNHEIELFSSTTGELVAWVNAPSLSSVVDTVLYMYYGNPSCSSQQNTEVVWDSSFDMVQHLNETYKEEEEEVEGEIVHDLGFRPHSLQGDDNYLYVGSMTSSDGVGLKILHKSDFSVYKHLDPSGIGTWVERISVSGDLVAFTQGTKGYVYNMTKETYITSLQVDAVNNLFSVYTDGEHVYFGEQDSGTIRRGNISTWVQDSFTPASDDIREIDGHGMGVENQHHRLIAASNDDYVYLIDRITPTTIFHTFTDSNSNAEVAQIDEDYIWYGSDDTTIWIREAASPYTLLATLTEPGNDITAVSHDGDLWFASCDDGNVYGWDGSSGFDLVRKIDKSSGIPSISAERLWLDTVNNHLYFIIDFDHELWRIDYPLSPSEFDKALDSTVNNNDGIYGGNPSIGVSGKINGAVDFDGSSSVNIVNLIDFDINDFSVSAWVKANGFVDYGAIVYNRDDATPNLGFSIRTMTPDIIQIIFDYGPSSCTVTESGLNTGEWYHIAATVDRDGFMRLYINGVETGNYDISGYSTYDITNSMKPKIGRGYKGFNGIIDEVRISNIARSAEWVESQYNNMNGGYVTLGSEEALPVADAGGPYENDDCSDTITFDGTGSYGLHGTIDFYNWDFGDGTGWYNDIGPTPSYAYGNFGEYIVTLRVIDNDGFDDDTDTATVKVYGVIADAGGPYFVKDSLTVHLDGSGSTGYELPLAYSWDFDDSDGIQVDSTELNPTHTYSSYGTYTVTLTVTESGNGCTDIVTTTVRCYLDPPTVVLIYPEGGETLKDTITIEWYAHDSQDGDDIPIYLYYFTDNNYYQINDKLENTGEYQWDTTTLPDGTYTLLVEAVDSDGSIGHDESELFQIKNHEEPPENQAPNKPNKPSGPANGKAGDEYSYTSSTSDPDGDQVWYIWDWGDGTNSGWLGPYNSGEICEASHVWEEKDDYNIKVKAKDEHGKESAWSDPLGVSIPRNRQMSNPIFQQILKLFIERFPVFARLFPIFNGLLNL